MRYGGRIAAKWRSYAEQVMPERMPRMRVIETRRAFYAGAVAILHLISQCDGRSTTHSDAMAPDELALLEEIHQEIEQWVRDLERGLV